MSKIFSLVKRNIKIFFSKKSNILFSTLALLILVGLHFLVFRKMNASILTDMGIGDKDSYWFSDMLMFSSLIPIGAITLSLTTLAQIVQDKEKNVINDLYVAPIKKSTLLTAYLLSSVIISTILLVGFVILFEFYLLIIYGISFSFLQVLSILGLVVLSILLANTFVMLIIAFVRREQAMGAIGTILGTLLGFICGAYVPIGVLGDGVATTLTFLPFLPITALARQIFFMNIGYTGLTYDIIGGELAKTYGYELYIGNTQISIAWLIGIVLIYVVLFLGILFLISKSRKSKRSKT